MQRNQGLLAPFGLTERGRGWEGKALGGFHSHIDGVSGTGVDNSLCFLFFFLGSFFFFFHLYWGDFWKNDE